MRARCFDCNFVFPPKHVFKECFCARILYTSFILGAITLTIRGLLEKYPTFGREKETGLLGALDT